MLSPRRDLLLRLYGCGNFHTSQINTHSGTVVNSHFSRATTLKRVLRSLSLKKFIFKVVLLNSRIWMAPPTAYVKSVIIHLHRELWRVFFLINSANAWEGSKFRLHLCLEALPATQSWLHLSPAPLLTPLHDVGCPMPEQKWNGTSKTIKWNLSARQREKLFRQGH